MVGGVAQRCVESTKLLYGGPGRAFVLKLTGQRISAWNCIYQLRGSDITGLSCKQTVGQSQLGILGSWAILSSGIERVLLGQ